MITLPDNISLVDGLTQIANIADITVEELFNRVFDNRTVKVQEINDISLVNAIAQYQNSKGYKKLSKDTNKSYSGTYNQLSSFLQGLVDKDPLMVSDIKLHMLNDFIDSFIEGKKKGTPITDSTLNRKVATIRSLYNYFYEFNIVNENIAKDIKFKKGQRSKPDYFTPDQQQKAYDLARQGRFGTRDFTLFDFLFNTGARKEGVINLNWQDIDFERQYITLDEKGDKRREVPLLPALSEQLRYYRHFYRDIFSANPNGPVFVNLQGNYRGQRITEDSIRSIIERTFEKMGITDAKVHRFRRTFAFNCSERGLKLIEIKELLGHERIATTVIYLGLNIEEVRKKLELYFPRAIVEYTRALDMGELDD